MPKAKVNIYKVKIGIIAEYNNTKYVICSDNLPNVYKNKTADKFFEHYQEVQSFALSLLVHNAKEKEPLLVSS